MIRRALIFAVLALGACTAANPPPPISANPAGDIANIAEETKLGQEVILGLQNSEWNLDQAIAIGVLPPTDPADACLHQALAEMGQEPGATVTGNVTVGGLNITNMSSTTGISPGNGISGAGIPAGDTVFAIGAPGTGTITLALPATASGVAVPLTVTNVIPSFVPKVAGIIDAGSVAYILAQQALQASGGVLPLIPVACETVIGQFVIDGAKLGLNVLPAGGLLTKRPTKRK